jgi:hypothetical protein
MALLEECLAANVRGEYMLSFSLEPLSRQDKRAATNLISLLERNPRNALPFAAATRLYGTDPTITRYLDSHSGAWSADCMASLSICSAPLLRHTKTGQMWASVLSEHPDFRVRYYLAQAVKPIGIQGNTPATTIVKRLLQDTDQRVRWRMSACVAKMPRATVDTRTLHAMLDDPSDLVRAEVASVHDLRKENNNT